MKNQLLFACCLCINFILTACAPLQAQTNSVPVSDYDACVAAGNVILRTFPPKCVTKDGKIFHKTEVRNIDGRLCKDQCGDGVCQEIVCRAAGCPCAETPENCPKDCAPEL